jgi:hypothetical protein
VKKTDEEKEGKRLESALMKVALGFSVEEITEEFGEVDGTLKLLKRKRTKKQVPPDLKAVQLLLAERGVAVADMTDEELEKEKQRLLLILSESGGQVLDESKKTVAKTPKTRKKTVKKGEKNV